MIVKLQSMKTVSHMRPVQKLDLPNGDGGPLLMLLYRSLLDLELDLDLNLKPELETISAIHRSGASGPLLLLLYRSLLIQSNATVHQWLNFHFAQCGIHITQCVIHM